MSSLREAITQAIKDEFYFDHLDCKDDCSKKDGELTSIGHATDAILLAIDSRIPEPSTYFKPEFITDSNRALNDAYLHGQEHFRDLMKEKLDV